MSVTIGRPRTCDCGRCGKCKQRENMRRWWNGLTPEQRRDKIARRDPAKVREQDRLKMARRRRQGSPAQRLRIEARKAVRLALARGDLTRQPCEVCGAEDVHAHHDDYERPLDVRWLCRPHHDELHLAEAA